MINVLMFKKPYRVLFVIFENKPKSMYHVSKILKTNYSYVTNMIHIFKRLGLVTLESNGRLLRLELTKKGLKLYKLIKKIQSHLK